MNQQLDTSVSECSESFTKYIGEYLSWCEKSFLCSPKPVNIYEVMSDQRKALSLTLRELSISDFESSLAEVPLFCSTINSDFWLDVESQENLKNLSQESFTFPSIVTSDTFYTTPATDTSLKTAVQEVTKRKLRVSKGLLGRVAFFEAFMEEQVQAAPPVQRQKVQFVVNRLQCIREEKALPVEKEAGVSWGIPREEHKEGSNTKPVIRELILKKRIVEELMEIMRKRRQEDDSFRSRTPRNISADEERFIVNVFEPRVSKKWLKGKARPVSAGTTKVDSKLYIEDLNESLQRNDATQVTSFGSYNLVAPNNSLASYNLPVPNNSLASYDTVHTNSTTSHTLTADSSSTFLESTTSQSSATTVLNRSLLVAQVNNQSRIMQEVSKAVEVCSSAKLLYGEEQLEAERILLLAGMKRALLLKQLRSQEFGEPPRSSASKGRAQLSVSNLEIPLVGLEEQRKHQVWYVITWSCDSTLQASELVKLPPSSHFLNFGKAFVFDNVSLDSKISLKIYKAKISSQPRESRWNRLSCVKRMHNHARRSLRIHYKDLYTGMAIQRDVYSSIFTLCGSLDTTVHELMRAKRFLFDATPEDSTFFGSLKMTAEVSNVSTSQSYFGFLTCGFEGQPRSTWQRKWARLDGTTVSFWDNPSEEGISDPSFVLDLQRVAQDEVLVADRSIGRHTLMVRMVEDANKQLTVKTYYLAADTRCDMKVWRRRLNSVLESLRHWTTLSNRRDL